MTHFVVATEGMSVEGLARLFRDNVWKLHSLPESVVLDRGPQFTAELTKELNKMNRNEVVNSVPPTNRWADQTNKPRVGIVLEVLCGS